MSSDNQECSIRFKVGIDLCKVFVEHLERRSQNFGSRNRCWEWRRSIRCCFRCRPLFANLVIENIAKSRAEALTSLNVRQTHQSGKNKFMRWNHFQELLHNLLITCTSYRGTRFTPMHDRRVTVIHHCRPDAAYTTASPSCRPWHPLKNRLKIDLELTKPRSALHFLFQQIQTRPSIFLRIMSTLAARLDLTVTPSFCKPCQAWFERSTTWMVVDYGRVDAQRVANFEGFEIRFKRVAEENGRMRRGRCRPICWERARCRGR